MNIMTSYRSGPGGSKSILIIYNYWSCWPCISYRIDWSKFAVFLMRFESFQWRKMLEKDFPFFTLHFPQYCNPEKNNRLSELRNNATAGNKAPRHFLILQGPKKNFILFESVKIQEILLYKFSHTSNVPHLVSLTLTKS